MRERGLTREEHREKLFLLKEGLDRIAELPGEQYYREETDYLTRVPGCWRH